LLRDVLVRMLMLSSGSIRDGHWPNWLPSIKEISKFLEVPGSDVSKIFLPADESDDNNSNPESDSGSDEDDDSDVGEDDKEPIKKEQKIKQRNKDSERNGKTRRERRSRERA